jgi:hypothetical protein
VLKGGGWYADAYSSGAAPDKKKEEPKGDAAKDSTKPSEPKSPKSGSDSKKSKGSKAAA